MTDNKTVESPIERSISGISPILVAVDGPLSGQTFYLAEPVVSIGRLESNEICLDDLYVSRHHCVIRNEGEQYMLEDLESANGTYVNGERVTAGLLKEGSLIQIGNSQFVFRLQESEESLAVSQSLISSTGERPSSASTRLG